MLEAGKKYHVEIHAKNTLSSVVFPQNICCEFWSYDSELDGYWFLTQHGWFYVLIRMYWLSLACYGSVFPNCL